MTNVFSKNAEIIISMDAQTLKPMDCGFNFCAFFITIA